MKLAFIAEIKPKRREAFGGRGACSAPSTHLPDMSNGRVVLPLLLWWRGSGDCTFSAELTGRGQPGGLPEGWSFRARGERPPESGFRDRAPRRGARTASWFTRASTVAGLAPLPGCMPSLAPLPGGGHPVNPRRPPYTVWQPSGLAEPKCPNKRCAWQFTHHDPSSLRSSCRCGCSHFTFCLRQPRAVLIAPLINYKPTSK
jgi:hypothetical protein